MKLYRAIIGAAGLAVAALPLSAHAQEEPPTTPSLLSIDKNSFGPTPATFTFDVVGSDGTSGTLDVATAPTGNTNPPTTRGVGGGFELTPGVTYTITERDPGPTYRWFDGAGFCFVENTDGIRLRTVYEQNRALTLSVAANEQVRCFVANLERGRIDVDLTTQPSIGKPFTVEIATRNDDGSYTVIDTLRVTDRQPAQTGLLDSRVTYWVRMPATKHWTTDQIRCGRSTATSGENWARAYLSDGGTLACTITTTRTT